MPDKFEPFVYRTTIKIHEIDAAGVMFFANYFKLAHDAFEEFLESRGLKIRELLEHATYLLPVVHASMDYRAPVRAGDKLSITLSVGALGKGSVTLIHEIYKDEEELVGAGEIIHASIDRRTGEKIPMPQELIDVFGSAI